MSKTMVQWKIFFDSMNSKKINLLDLGLFTFNALLNIFIAGVELSKGKSPYSWLYGIIWLVGAFLFFLRLFYNQSSLKFSRTLPCTKKLYTKYIWISFEVLNFLTVIEWIILWIVLGAIGNDVTMFGVIFFFICIAHLILSAGIPFTSIILAQEEKINMYSGIQKIGTTTKLLLFIIALCGGFTGMYLISKVLINSVVETSFFTGNWLIPVCSFILVISCVINKIMFSILYKK